MLIQFTRDYRGAATDEAFYEAGTVIDLPRGAEIVAEGAAVDATPAPEPAEEPKPKGRKVGS